MTAVTIIQKTYNDHFYCNVDLAMLGGVDVKELNALESNFLHVLDFDVYISSREFDLYKKKVEDFFYKSQDPQTGVQMQRIKDEMSLA